RFLAGDDPEPGLEVQFFGGTGERGGARGGERADGSPERPSGRWGGWRFVTAGLAVGGLAAGTVLRGLAGRCTATPPMGQLCRSFHDSQPGGYAALAGGAVFARISIYLFATHDSAPVVAPTQGGATIGFATRF